MGIIGGDFRLQPGGAEHDLGWDETPRDRRTRVGRDLQFRRWRDSQLGRRVAHALPRRVAGEKSVRLD